MHRIFTNFVENAEHPVKRSSLVARAAAFAAIILPKKLVDGSRSAGSCGKDGPCCRG
jgi:hypothetical protein